MAIRGVEPSYFAGMPTVQRDLRAGQPNAEYMQMPGQALSEIASRNERRREADQNNAFRAREQGHREEQDRSSAARDDRRLAMYQQGEDRRQHQQQFENDRLKSADTMKLVQAMQAAINDGEHGIAEAIAAELKGRGWGVKPLGAQGASAGAQPMRQAAPEAGAPEIGSQDMSWIESGAPAGPMSPRDAQTSAELDQAEQSILPRLRGTGPTAPSTSPAVATPAPMRSPQQPGAQDVALSNQLDQADKLYSQGLAAGRPVARQTSPQDAALAAQLDQAESRYMNGLQPRPLVPGGARSPLRSRAIQADQLLSADDPLNRIVQ